MIDWNAVSAVATALAAGVGIVTAILAYSTFRRAKEAEFQEQRPFMIPSLHVEVADRTKRLYLSIRNYGNTPAKDVRLEFAPGQAWNWVQKPDYPFVSHKGISAIGPGQTLTYFLGEIRKGTPLGDIETRDIDVTVSCDHPIKKERIVDGIRMSLQDNRYKARDR